jgi:hypothetical protein
MEKKQWHEDTDNKLPPLVFKDGLLYAKPTHREDNETINEEKTPEKVSKDNKYVIPSRKK